LNVGPTCHSIASAGLIAALTALRAAIRDGITERELADVAVAALAANGARSGFGIVGASVNGSFPHHQTRDTVRRPGQPIVCEIGARKAEYFTHRTGHGLGSENHEPPYITATNPLPLEEGMVFTVEPGIYLPGRFGIRLEEVAVVTATGCRILSGLPRDLHIA